MVKLIGKLDEEEIKEITRSAFSLSLDYYKLTLLCALSGVGPALAATLLSFHNPQSYGLLEHSAWNQLFLNKKADVSIKGYIAYLERLREISKDLRVPVRIVEQALVLKDSESLSTY
jgi:hypothetical protein